jgi:hypothetical protein
MKNYVVMGGGTITIDISELANNTTITFGGTYIGDTATNTYGNSETASISTIKTWTVAHTITVLTGRTVKILYNNGKITISTSSTQGAVMYSVTVND